MGEVASQDIQHRLLAPGGDQVGVNQFVAIVSAVLDGDQYTGINCIFVEEFVNAVGEVLDDDADFGAWAVFLRIWFNLAHFTQESTGLVSLDHPHLIEGKRNTAGGIGMLLVGHEVVELAVPAQIRGHEVGIGRIGIVTDVDVEGQIADLAGVLGAGVTDLVAEPQVGGVGGIYRRSGAPGLFAGEGFTVGDGVFFILSMGISLGATPGAT